MRNLPLLAALHLLAVVPAQVTLAVANSDTSTAGELPQTLGANFRLISGPEFSTLGPRSQWPAVAARLTANPAPFLLVLEFAPGAANNAATSVERSESCTVTLLSCRLGQVALTHQENGIGRGGTAEVATRKARRDLMGKLAANLPKLLQQATGAAEWNTYPCRLKDVPKDGLGNLLPLLESAMQTSGLTVSQRLMEPGASVPSFLLTLEGGASFAGAATRLTRGFEQAGLDAFFLARAVPAGSLEISCKEPRQEVVVQVTELDEPREATHGGRIVDTLQSVPGLQVRRRLYDGSTRTWTLSLFTHLGAAAIDSVLARNSDSPARKDMVLLTLADDGVAYRMRTPTQTLHVEVLNVPPTAMLEAGGALDAAMGRLDGASDYLRTNEPTQRTVRFQLRYNDSLQKLEQGVAAILRTLKVPGELRPTVASLGQDLAFEFVEKTRLLLVRLEGMPAAEFQTAGESFVEALRSLPSSTLVDRRFDTANNRVEVTLSIDTQTTDVDHLIWTAIGRNEALAKVAPDTSDGSRRNFVWGDAPGAAGVPVVLVGMNTAAMAVDGGAFVTMLRSIEGVTGVESRFSPELQELAIEVRTKLSAPSLEAAILAAIGQSATAPRILPAGRQGRSLQFRVAELSSDRQQHLLYVHADLGKTNAEASKALEAIVQGLPGASDFVLAHGERALDVHFLCANPPPVVHDDLQRSLREEKRLQNIAILQLDGPSILLGTRESSPVAPVAAAPTPTPGAGAGTSNQSPASPNPTPTPTPAQPTPITGATTPPTAAATPVPAATPTLADVVERALPSVVHIDAECGGSAWLGSGFIVSSRGLIMTNQHVAGAPEGKSQGDVRLRVKLTDGSTHPARYLAGDGERDLALIQIAAENLRAVTFGDSDRLRLAEPVMVIGSGHGYEFSVTTGILSARRTEKGWLQTDALTNPGNSGGPAFDLRGNVIGVCVAGSVSRFRLGSEKLVIPNPGINFLIEGKLASQFLSTALNSR